MAENSKEDRCSNYSSPKGSQRENNASNALQPDDLNLNKSPQNNSAFNNQENQGRFFGGLHAGGIVDQGDKYSHSSVTHVHIHGNYNGPSILNSYAPADLPTNSKQHITEESQFENFESVQTSLREMYLKRFKKTNPYTLPFTFDIENTWVSLALRGDTKQSKQMEDHAELLKSAFEKEKMLIIEGKPATGKTSLMRRLAYEWAKGEHRLSHYDLVLYVEFREVREKQFETIADLVLEYNNTLVELRESEEAKQLASLLVNRRYCEQRKILLLLDGYDESSLHKQCKEFHDYVTFRPVGNLVFNIVVTTRPGYLGKHPENEGRYIFADVLGFETDEQKEKFITNHFSSDPEKEKQESIAAVCELLETNENVYKLAETPLFLTFICLVHERLENGTVLELYCNIIWWMINRHQTDNPDRDVPNLFEFYQRSSDKFRTIQDNYLQFPQLLHLGQMAFNNLEKDVLDESDCVQYNLKEIIQQVGLLRKDKIHSKLFRLKTTFAFPHRTIQEFLAAIYCFCSHEQFDKKFKSDFSTLNMKEYDTFLLRIALSEKIRINEDTRTHYFDAIKDIFLDASYNTLHTSKGANLQLLNRLLSQCNNIRSLEIHNCIFEANSYLSFNNNISMKKMELKNCTIHCGNALGIVQLKEIHTLEFHDCNINETAWELILEVAKKKPVSFLSWPNPRRV